MILTSLPDCKTVHKDLTLGKDYAVLQIVGNGVVIATNDPEFFIILLASRFDSVIESTK